MGLSKVDKYLIEEHLKEVYSPCYESEDMIIGFNRESLEDFLTFAKREGYELFHRESITTSEK